jgi:prolyl oligopeptidase
MDPGRTLNGASVTIWQIVAGNSAMATLSAKIGSNLPPIALLSFVVAMPATMGSLQAGDNWLRLPWRARHQRAIAEAPIANSKLATSAKPFPMNYPTTRRGDQVDLYHGKSVADPYRWLEDLDSDETRGWVQSQNQLTDFFLSSIPSRQRYRQRLTELWNFERFTLPVKRGGRYFFTRNDGLQNQNAVFVLDRLDGVPRLLLDPNAFSADGTIALANWVPSEDGKLLAYGLARAGSDWQEWRVMEIDSGRALADQVQWVKFSRVSWTPDNAGFFYSRYDEPRAGETYTGTNYYHKLFYHRVGQKQSDDKPIYRRDDQKEWSFDGQVTDDGHYLVITISKNTDPKTQLFCKDLRLVDSPVVELITGFDADYEFVGNDGETFWVLTDFDAPLKRLIAVDRSQPARDHWREVIPETKDVLWDVSLVGGRFIAQYLEDAKSAVRVFDLTGKHQSDVELPDLGSAGGFSGRNDDPETFYSFGNYTTPGTIYRYDVAAGKSTIFRQPKVAFDPAQLETKQVFCTSKDGTRVPMMIVARKGLVLDGTHPTILYAYGGFNISQTPGFATSTIAWLENGGVYAVANLRGGGEYGRQWHEAGMLDKKQNVFDDFYAAAESLIAHKYTSPSKLAIRGGSNGGLLVGAAITQRPELFGAAVPAVGVMDMLRYHKFTIGWAWVGEYGSSDDPQQFANLLRYSPLHNLKPGTKYPPTLVTTGDHDDRVVPGHSYKFAAELQAAQAGDAPVLIRIETRAGHGAGKPTTKLIEEAADVLAFLSRALGVD